MRARAQVREDIRAAEAVDGLLGIADDHETALRGPRCAMGTLARIDLLEDPGLQAIRILELVDQGDGIASAYALRQCRSLFFVECAVQFREQGVEAQAAMLPGVVSQRPSGLFEE